MKTINEQDLKSISGGENIIVTQVLNVDEISSACVNALLVENNVNPQAWEDNIYKKCSASDLFLLEIIQDETPAISIVLA